MKRDSKLSGILHVLLHMACHDQPITSEQLARIMHTHPVVIRRLLAGLRQRGYVRSEKGHGGGWQLSGDLHTLTLADIWQAVGEPALIALHPRNTSPDCLVERAVNHALDSASREAEAILLNRLGEITLAALAADFKQHLPGNYPPHLP